MVPCLNFKFYLTLPSDMQCVSYKAVGRICNFFRAGKRSREGRAGVFQCSYRIQHGSHFHHSSLQEKKENGNMKQDIIQSV